MGLLKKQYIDSNFVLSNIEDSIIFYAYFGEFELGKIYASVFREDRNPSTGFYLSSSNKLIYNDISTGEKLDCFAFVAKKYGLTYSQAIKKIAEDFGLVGNNKIFSKEELLEKVANAKNKVEKEIKIKPDDWTDTYLKFWEQFYITKKELIENDVFPVKTLYINDIAIPNYSKNVRYAYLLKYKDKVYKKIYQPFGDVRFVGNIPIYIPFGVFDLPYKSDTLIITKAQKDRIIFKKYFTDVIAIQNESAAALRDSLISYLKNKYKKIYINCDSDTAGINAMRLFKEKGLIPLMLPKVLVKEGIKDVADFVKTYGLKRFEDFLKYKKLK